MREVACETLRGDHVAAEVPADGATVGDLLDAFSRSAAAPDGADPDDDTEVESLLIPPGGGRGDDDEWECAVYNPASRRGELLRSVGIAGGGRVRVARRCDMPACDYCGRRFSSAGERGEHAQRLHEPELRDLCRWEAELATAGALARPPGPEALAELGRAAALFAAPAVDDAPSFEAKQQVQRQLQCILQETFPKSQLYMFGSAVSGLAEKTSGLDLAADLFGDRQPRRWAPADEREMCSRLQKVWRQYHPFPHTADGAGAAARPGDGSHAVLRTRVPVVSCRPPAAARAAARRRDPGLARTVWWEVPREHAAAFQQHLLDRCRGVIDIDSHWHDGRGRFIVRCKHELHAVSVKILLEKVPGLTAPDSFPRFHDDEQRVHLPAVYTSPWDLTFRLHGVINSLLLRRYIVPSPSVRLAAICVKSWSKRRSEQFGCCVNDSQHGMLTSYAVVVMFIYYCVATGELQWIDPELVQLDEGLNLMGHPVPPLAPLDTECVIREAGTIGRLVFGFFDFYTSRFDYGAHVVSLNTDPRLRRVTREEKGWTPDREVYLAQKDSVHYQMCIEDPYECRGEGGGGLNLARHLTRHKAARVRLMLREAREACATARCPHAAFFADADSP